MAATKTFKAMWRIAGRSSAPHYELFMMVLSNGNFNLTGLHLRSVMYKMPLTVPEK